MTPRSVAGTLARRLLPLAIVACGAWVADTPAIGARPIARVTFLPAALAQRIGGAQEVTAAPPAAAQPIGRLHAPRLGDSRMVLAGAGLPLPAAGPGRLYLSPYAPAPGTLLLPVLRNRRPDSSRVSAPAIRSCWKWRAAVTQSTASPACNSSPTRRRDRHRHRPGRP